MSPSGKRQKSHRWQDDPYTQKAMKEGYVARSIYKLEEIDQKFGVFDPTVRTVLDIGCAPGSRLQYVSERLKPQHHPGSTIIGIDLKPIEITLPGISTYVGDATDRDVVGKILATHHITTFDCILSDMAPDTTSNTDLDAIRSIDMLERIMRLVDAYLAPEGIFIFKIFMGPGFDEFVKALKNKYGAAHIRLFKPNSSRKASKETFIIKK